MLKAMLLISFLILLNSCLLGQPKPAEPTLYAPLWQKDSVGHDQCVGWHGQLYTETKGFTITNEQARPLNMICVDLSDYLKGQKFIKDTEAWEKIHCQ